MDGAVEGSVGGAVTGMSGGADAEGAGEGGVEAAGPSEQATRARASVSSPAARRVEGGMASMAAETADGGHRFRSRIVERPSRGCGVRRWDRCVPSPILGMYRLRLPVPEVRSDEATRSARR